ncbi:hypothetical protein GWI33_012460 [Rhynchophorus ferrugineus]|uniref:Uncharacterized protein n=1 Tax=Rhynchophorus ferrugineus TaxID=354439 RepID=A0A834I5G9_RHYFE|nr:hypothetical protein GWI33_012460 [Rhynchophorus ferrugineus]
MKDRTVFGKLCSSKFEFWRACVFNAQLPRVYVCSCCGQNSIYERCYDSIWRLWFYAARKTGMWEIYHSSEED